MSIFDLDFSPVLFECFASLKLTMKLNTLCTFALAFLAAPLSVTAEKEPLIKETLEVIKALNNAVAAYQGGIAGIPTVFSAMRNTMGIRKKLNDYVASVTMYDEKDCAVIRNTTSMTADAMVDLLNMGRVKVLIEPNLIYPSDLATSS